MRDTDSVVSLDTHFMAPDVLWKCVRAELDAGHTIHLIGPLVSPMLERFGKRQSEICFVPIVPHPPPPLWLSRTRDIFCAGAALILLSPLIGLPALLVKLSSAGPIFHKATVVGLGGRQFVWRKFRSMRVVSEHQDHAARREQFRAYIENRRQGKVIDSTRVTRLGAFLRKYSLDELPQLWNVLKGDMALVGPRPCLPYEADMFPAWGAPRFDVLPGLTGVWQIAGRSRVTFAQGLVMDVYYRYARSFRLDLYLIVQTVRVIVRGEGGE